MVGGDRSGPGELPWSALVFTRKAGERDRCGGTPVSAQFVLTSASCVEDVDVIKVWLGGGRLFSDPKLLKLDVRGDPIIHPGRSFRRSSFGEILSVKNNFALLQLSKPVNFRQHPHIQTACLPASSGTY